MSNVQQHQDEIKRLEYLQRRGGLSTIARRQIVGTLAREIAAKNIAVGKRNHEEARRGTQDKHEVGSRELFDKAARGKVVLGPRS